MKVLSGVYPTGTYTGEIVVDGQVEEFSRTKDSESVGVVVIYQELALVKFLSVIENIFLGNEIHTNGTIDWMEATKRTKALLEDIHLKVDPEELIMNLGIGEQQLVEIAKALSKDVKILVLDEPTAALNESESANLLNILRRLKKNGVTCIYISHKLEEVLEIADSVTVLRDGQTIETREVSEGQPITEDEIIRMMVGRTLTQRFPSVEHHASDTLMEIRNWEVYHPEITNKKVIDDVSFEVRRGEILGIAGLMGAGRTELAMSIFGAYGSSSQGQIFINGQNAQIHSPWDAITSGIAYVTEDRKNLGLVLGMNIIENSTLASHFRLSRGQNINKLEEIMITRKYTKQLHVKMASLEQKVNTLSGGNQQKVILGKWLMTPADSSDPG
jgi:putative multiple sugar transport system ATP-binding protein